MSTLPGEIRYCRIITRAIHAKTHFLNYKIKLLKLKNFKVVKAKLILNQKKN